MVRDRLAIGSGKLFLIQQPSKDHYSIPKKYSSRGVSLLRLAGVNLLRPEGVSLLRLVGVNLTGFC
ncbi:MAG: hypothetical protein LPK25_07335, partial [Cyclobacteriaceae bacterium]|nr:hypothetical protein [Cyclobacteriaceae bacterium]